MTSIHPSISVVIGTYNGAAYLERQLASLEAQTLPPYEIILCDDGSTDDTLTIAHEFASRCPIAMTVRQNSVNLGFGENFLQAASYASGQYVAFCDQDDIWRAHKLARCGEALAQSGVVLAVHVADLIDRDEKPIGNFRQGIAGDIVRPPLSYGPWDVFFGFSMVFDRRLLDIIPPDARGIDYITGRSKLAHDRWILFLANLAGCIAEISEPLADYRQHGMNLFGSAKTSFRKSHSQILSESNLYLQSAHEMRTIVEILCKSSLPADFRFNKDDAIGFWDAALAQQYARNTLYRAEKFNIQLLHWFKNIHMGVYCKLPGRRFRKNAAIKDFLFLIDGLTLQKK